MPKARRVRSDNDEKPTHKLHLPCLWEEGQLLIKASSNEENPDQELRKRHEAHGRVARPRYLNIETHTTQNYYEN